MLIQENAPEMKVLTDETRMKVPLYIVPKAHIFLTVWTKFDTSLLQNIVLKRTISIGDAHYL